MWGLLAPWHTPYAETFMCAPSTSQGQTTYQISASYHMHHAVMRMCISHRLSIIYTQKWGFGGFEGEHVKLLCSIPKRHYPA